MAHSLLLSQVKPMLEVLEANEYSPLWELVEDFEVNGHIVSVNRSTWFKHIIIDNAYYNINTNCVVYDGDKRYETALDYVVDILNR